jgi:hypothetical protein
MFHCILYMHPRYMGRLSARQELVVMGTSFYNLGCLVNDFFKKALSWAIHLPAIYLVAQIFYLTYYSFYFTYYSK